MHPGGFRVGIIHDWKSHWYSDTNYAEQVVEDAKIRDMLNAELTRGAVSRIEIVWADVDEPKDLRRLAVSLTGNGAGCPRTRALLASWGRL